MIKEAIISKAPKGDLEHPAHLSLYNRIVQTGRTLEAIDILSVYALSGPKHAYNSLKTAVLSDYEFVYTFNKTYAKRLDAEWVKAQRNVVATDNALNKQREEDLRLLLSLYITITSNAAEKREIAVDENIFRTYFPYAAHHGNIWDWVAELKTVHFLRVQGMSLRRIKLNERLIDW